MSPPALAVDVLYIWFARFCLGAAMDGDIQRVNRIPRGRICTASKSEISFHISFIYVCTCYSLSTNLFILIKMLSIFILIYCIFISHDMANKHTIQYLEVLLKVFNLQDSSLIDVSLVSLALIYFQIGIANLRWSEILYYMCIWCY